MASASIPYKNAVLQTDSRTTRLERPSANQSLLRGMSTYVRNSVDIAMYIQYVQLPIEYITVQQSQVCGVQDVGRRGPHPHGVVHFGKFVKSNKIVLLGFHT